jgi:hypothetical protein
MRRLPAGKASSTLGRVRWFRGSLEVQTEQSHPRTGTPVDVPVPRKISRRAGTVGLSINRLNLQDAGNAVSPARFRDCLRGSARDGCVQCTKSRASQRHEPDRHPLSPPGSGPGDDHDLLELDFRGLQLGIQARVHRYERHRRSLALSVLAQQAARQASLEEKGATVDLVSPVFPALIGGSRVLSSNQRVKRRRQDDAKSRSTHHHRHRPTEGEGPVKGRWSSGDIV